VKVLVTGGGGFLGSAIVRALVARGDRVRILARSHYPELESLGAEAVAGDVSDRAAVERAAAGVEVVFHTAALPKLFGKPGDFVRTNLTGTEVVIEVCRAVGVARLVHTSTPSVVFGDEALEGADEDTPYPDPASYLAEYPRTKAEAERRVLAAHAPGRFHTVALRPHLIFGPGDRHLVPRIVARARAGKLARIGDGANLISVTTIENAVHAHLLAERAIVAPEAAAGGRAYFVNEPEPVNLWAFVDRILEGFGAPRPTRAISYTTARRLGAALELTYRALGLRGEPRMTRFLAAQLGKSHWFKIERARRDLGYAPKQTLDEGLAALFSAPLAAVP
jgi:nucleoside-diphosphate-sugar epimerase